MHLYIAAPWATRHDMPEIVARFEAAGHTVPCRWWEFPDVPNMQHPDYHDQLEDNAVQDYLGVIQAEALVVINSDLSEGKAVEMGMAIAHNLPVVLIGERTNLFHFIPSVVVVPDVRQALRKLRG